MKNRLIVLLLIYTSLFSFKCTTRNEYISDFDAFSNLIRIVLMNDVSINSFYISKKENTIEINSFLSQNHQKLSIMQFDTMYNHTGVDSILYYLNKLDFTGYEVVKHKWIEFYFDCPLLSRGCYTIQYLMSVEEIKKKKKVDSYIKIDSNIFVIPNSGLAIE